MLEIRQKTAWFASRALDRVSCAVRASWYLREIDAHGRRCCLRNSVFVRNGGTIRLGDRVCIHPGPVGIELTTLLGGVLEIGDDVMINYGCSFNASGRIRIGNRCRIGIGVSITDSGQHCEAPARRGERPVPRPVEIENDVWIASRVIILPGVTLGHGCIVGAGSVVTRSVPPNMLALGNPAKVVRAIDIGDGRPARVAPHGIENSQPATRKQVVQLESRERPRRPH